MRPRAQVDDSSRTAEFLHQILNLAPLLLGGEAVGKLCQQNIIDVLTSHRTMHTHQLYNEIQVILLLETTLTNVPPGLTGRTCNNAWFSSGTILKKKSDRLRIYTLHRSIFHLTISQIHQTIIGRLDSFSFRCSCGR